MEPEKKLEKEVEKEVLKWAKENGWSLDVYDSKGTYSFAAKSYRANRGLKKGTPDLQGCDPFGHLCLVELKAPKKDDCCSFEQREFLERKIQNFAFGIVTSSAQKLSDAYNQWLQLRYDGKLDDARDYLLGLLPNKVLVRGLVMYLKDESAKDE